MPLHILSPQSTILPSVTVAFGLLATAAGLTSILSPQDGITNFGLKPVTDEAGSQLAEALVQVYGVRNASLGLTNIAMWWLGRHTTGPVRVGWRRALGLLFVMNVFTPLVDGMVCERQGKTTGWTHWFFVPVTLLVGGALLSTPGTI